MNLIYFTVLCYVSIRNQRAMAVQASLGKRDFGSFHSSNVEELIRIPEEQYRPPEIPVERPSFTERAKFGQETKEKHFLLDGSWTFINHGAFGAALKQALQAAMKWQTHCELQPLRFLDRELLPHLVFVTRRLAQFIDADPRDVVLVPNVTTGVNAVVHSLAKTYTADDTVLMFNTTYGAVKKLLQKVSGERGFSLKEVTLQFPVHSATEILDALEAALKLHDSVRLVVIDHISSNYGVVFPVKRMIALCHLMGAQVLVDGAHALGSLPLSMREIGADYYASNAHKWLCCPKGCGFLYVHRSLQHLIKPLLVSHGYDSGFSSSFIWSGLRDYSPLLALHTVLDFWLHRGPDAIRTYIHSTARAAGERLVRAWDTELLASADLFGPMVLVALPDGTLSEGGPYSYQHAEQVQNTLYHQFRIEVPVKAIQGRLYVRVSAHIYNRAEDYEALASAVLSKATACRTHPPL